MSFHDFFPSKTYAPTISQNTKTPNTALNKQSNLVRDFDDYKNSLTIEKLTEVFQTTFIQDLKDQKKSIDDLVLNVTRLPEVLKPLIENPILQVSNLIQVFKSSFDRDFQAYKEG